MTESELHHSENRCADGEKTEVDDPAYTAVSTCQKQGSQIGTCFMLMIIGWWMRQALAQTHSSNINSWRVFCPLDGACCFWQVRRKSRAAKYVLSLKTTAAMVNVGKSQRLFIWTLISSISLNLSTAQRQLGREQHVIADMKRSKVTSGGCQSLNALAWLHAAKKLKCLQVSAH